MTVSPTNMKIITTSVIVVVLMVAMAGVILYDKSIHDSNGSTTTYNLLARVNSEGSGVYMNADLDENAVAPAEIPDRGGAPYYKVNPDGSFYVDASCKNAWDKLVCGTPGNTSIQHTQIQKLVQAAGLEFVPYESGMSLDSGKVYYINTITNFSTVENCKANNGVDLDVGILWEPQFSKIVSAPLGGIDFKTLGLTNDFYPDHTCCVLAGFTSYVSSNSDVTIRFLNAYIEAVNWVNDPANHAELVDICVNATKQTPAVIESALASIQYLYGDASGDAYDLHMLKRDIAGIADDQSKTLKHTMRDLGFHNTIQFANRLVDDSYLLQATSGTYEEGTRSANLTVAAIAGDVHQIALQVAVEKGFFENHHLTVSIAAQPNGAGVAVAMQNGAAQFGFLGAPPATITAINSELITV